MWRISIGFLRVWILGIFNPARAFDELKGKPAPAWGFAAVAIRFVFTSLTTILALHLLGREPFVSSYLTFLRTEDYYVAEIFFLPLFGLVLWLLGSAIVHVVLRLMGEASDFDQILNVVGMGMLIPMPAVWLWDWTAIAVSWYRTTVMAASHALFALWGAVLYAIGLKKILGLRTPLASGLAAVVMGVYIGLAMIFIR